jgi:hypothetical protein
MHKPIDGAGEHLSYISYVFLISAFDEDYCMNPETLQRKSQIEKYVLVSEIQHRYFIASLYLSSFPLTITVYSYIHSTSQINLLDRDGK